MQSKSSDCEGRLVVGGKLDVSNYAVGSRLVQNCSRIDLQVGGDFIGKDGQTSRGRTTVGGTNYAEDSWGTPCGPIENDPISFDIDAAFNDFISQSTSMGQQSSTGTETVSYSDLYLSGNDSNVNYFNVDSSILPSIRGIHIDIPSESWATVNFHGTSAEFEDMNFFLSSTTNKQKVLYNFPEAEVIYSTRNSFQGSLLAPTASLYDSNGNIEGSVAVSSYCGSGEFHNYPYIPPSSSCRCIPCTKSITLPSFEYYSLFIHKNINSEATDFEGRVAAGGDVNFNFIGVGSKLNESLNLDALQVNGDLYYHDGDVKGNVIVEGSSDIQDVSVSGETSQGSTGINFSHQFLELEAHSEFLSLWNANGNVDVIYSTIDLYGQDFYLNTFNIDYNTLENARTIVLSVPTNSHVIINVDGSGSPSSTVKFQNSGIFLNGASPSRILWNFFNLHHLEMSSIQIEGSLLAPNVDVSFSSGNLNGAIFAKSYTGGGEIHLSGWVPLPVPCIPCPC